jgi:hypothetical protein
MISSLYEWETIGLTAKKWKVNQGRQLVVKYQVKELFWEDETLVVRRNTGIRFGRIG